MSREETQRALNFIDLVSVLTEFDPAYAMAFNVEDLKKKGKQLIKRTLKEETDNRILVLLVYLIKMIGFSQQKSFQLAHFVFTKQITKARIKKLWFDTQGDNPDVIEEIRQSCAYYIVSSFMEWKDSDQTKGFPSPPPGPFSEMLVKNNALQYAVTRLERVEPELFYWVLEKAVQDSLGKKHEDFEPDYAKYIEALEMDSHSDMDTLSIMKKIASTD